MSGSVLIPEERTGDALGRRLREEAQASRDAGAGWVIDGNRYDDGSGWDFDALARHDHCPDKTPERFAVDAQFVVGRFRKDGRLRASAGRHDLKRLRVTSYDDLVAMREATRWTGRIKEWGYTPDPFAYGSEQAVPGAGGGVLGQYLPLWPGPVTRQLYWQDYFAMSAKAFEAYNHDPVSWRSVHMKQEFALGKGLQAKVTFSAGSAAGQHHDAAQAVWDEFWDRNKMDARMDMFARDLSWGGEQFMRYFQKGRMLTVRSLDPASIYDLITDPEDMETVFAYHQQFQTAYQLYAPTGPTPPGGVQSPTGPTQTGAATRFIIRQILPQEIDHYRINTSAYERRGRSDLFPGLGWIKRLRDYLTSHVISADLASRICWDLTVKGNLTAVSAVRNALFPGGRPPAPGSVFGHNEASTLTPLVPQRSATGGRYDPVLDALVTMVANSIGLPKDWLNFGMQNTRAGALVATEPAARSLEELQGTVEGVVHDCFERVMRAAGITDAQIEITFPSIASEDRTQLLQDLAFAEANGWVAKATAGAIAAKNLGITSYDYEQEQGLIADEFPEPEMEDVPDAAPGPDGKIPQRPKKGDGVPRRSVIVAKYRQAAKLDITKSPSQEDEPPGLLVPTDGSAVPTAPAGGNGGPPPTRNGMPSDENPLSAAGAKNIKQDNTRESEPLFTSEQVRWLLMRERERRRRPDDPEFQRASREYREGSAENLAQLVRDAIPSAR